MVGAEDGVRGRVNMGVCLLFGVGEDGGNYTY